MRANTKQRADKRFVSVSLSVSAYREYAKLAKAEKRSIPKMVEAALESWKKLHCPECGAELGVRGCVCKTDF